MRNRLVHDKQGWASIIEGPDGSVKRTAYKDRQAALEGMGRVKPKRLADPEKPAEMMAEKREAEAKAAVPADPKQEPTKKAPARTVTVKPRAK